MSRSIRPRRRSKAVLIGVASVAFVALVIAVLFAGSATTRGNPTAQVVAPHFVDISPGHSKAVFRTLVIAGPGERLPFMSETGSVLMANLVRGQLPADAVRATVLTDANCQPDQDGISHC